MNKTATNDKYIDSFLKEKHIDVRSDGTIWSNMSRNGQGLTSDKRPRRKDIKSGGGYRIVNYLVNGKYFALLAHRIVYRKYCGKLNNKLEINHKDGVRDNNIPRNIELVTSKENLKHAAEKLGSKFVRYTKINMEIANSIRVDKTNGMKSRDLVKKYGVHRSTIYAVTRNITWKSPS